MIAIQRLLTNGTASRAFPPILLISTSRYSFNQPSSYTTSYVCRSYVPQHHKKPVKFVQHSDPQVYSPSTPSYNLPHRHTPGIRRYGQGKSRLQCIMLCASTKGVNYRVPAAVNLQRRNVRSCVRLILPGGLENMVCACAVCEGY